MVTVVKALVNVAKFSVIDAEVVMSMLSTWGSKFNMIILSISTGVIVSLIPILHKVLLRKIKRILIRKLIKHLIYY